jgi:hypothetical protein
VSRPDLTVYRIPSVGLGGAMRLGSAAIAAFSLVPCLLIAFAGAWLIHRGRLLLESWQSAAVRVPAVVTNVEVHMNFVDLLQLRPFLNILISWDDRLWLTFAILWLIPWFCLIVAGALFALVLALIYNLVGAMGGGLRVTATPDEASASGAWSPALPAGQPPTWPAEGRR